MGSQCAQNTTTNPCSLLSRHKPLSGGYIRTQNTAKPTPKQHPQRAPTQYTPFPGLNLKVGEKKYLLGKMDSNLENCLKSSQKKNFSKSGQKKMKIIRCNNEFSVNLKNLLQTCPRFAMPSMKIACASYIPMTASFKLIFKLWENCENFGSENKPKFPTNALFVGRRLVNGIDFSIYVREYYPLRVVYVRNHVFLGCEL